MMQYDEEETEPASFAQFVDDEDASLTSSDIESNQDEALSRSSEDEQQGLRKKLAQVPFSALLRARRSLHDQGAADADEDENGEEEDDEFADDRQAAERRTLIQKRRELEKRDDKHAPTEVSSRKPVSRRRQVVESRQATVRDPRFSSLSTSAPNKGLFTSSYGFLREQQHEELTQLKQTLRKLKKQEAHHAGPRAASQAAMDIREERLRVEAALRREEGRENERRKREHEGDVIRRAKKEIEDKVREGSKRYYLKDSEKKKLILEDKFSRLAGPKVEGEHRPGALKRAVERRRKKNAAKDRHIPLGGGGGGGGRGTGENARRRDTPNSDSGSGNRQDTRKRHRST